MNGTTKQIAQNCKTRIEALTPLSYWNSSERITVLDGQPNQNIIATSGNHRSAWCYWVGGTEDISALSLTGLTERNSEIEIVVLYQAPAFSKEAGEQASQMAREDTDQIISTLQLLSGQPVCYNDAGAMIGRCLNRRFISGSDTIEMDEGKALLTMRFSITYEIIIGGY